LQELRQSYESKSTRYRRSFNWNICICEWQSKGSI